MHENAILRAYGLKTVGKFPNPDTQFKLGNPGGGRTPGKNRATIINQFLELQADKIPALKKLIDDLPEGVTVEQAIGLALIREAAKGDVAAIRELQDTVHGKIVDKTEVGLTFTQMGKVGVKTEDGKAELSFDVGTPALPVITAKE